MGLRQKKQRRVTPADPPGAGERWGCLIVDRPSRFVAAHATGPRVGEPAAAAVRQAHARSGGRPPAWVGDGWQPYRRVIERAYRRPVRTGKRGRPCRPGCG